MSTCAVIVTYNRKKLLLRCIKNCLNQNESLDIFIFDNHSTDGTELFLKECGIFENPNVTYFYSEKNLGGSGGFSHGMQMAYKCHYDFIWLMDDDGYPLKESCLQECLKVYHKYGLDKVIVNALVVGDDFSTLSFKTGGYKTKEKLVQENPEGVLEKAISPFNGTLVSKEIINLIGYPRFDFFIKGDETEYTYRAKSKGISLVTATKAEFYHPIMPIYERKFLFFKSPQGEEPYWKEYYKARNYVYIYTTYFGKVQIIKHIVNCLLKCCNCREDRKRKRKYIIRGLRDGFLGKFENIKID